MNLKQLEEIFDAQIKNEYNKKIEDLRNLLITQIRLINFSHGFDLDEIIKAVEKHAFPKHVIEDFYKRKKEEKLKEIAHRVNELDFLLREKP